MKDSAVSKIVVIEDHPDNARLAEELRLGEQTVRNYLSRLYSKIGVRTRSEAIVWARDRRSPH